MPGVALWLVWFGTCALTYGSEPDAGDGSALDGGDLGRPAVECDGFTGLIGQVAQLGEDEPGDGGVVGVGGTFQLDAQVGEIVYGEGAREQDAAVGFVPGLGYVAVGLVVDLADQFLDQILERDDAVHGTVLVNHERQLFPVGFEPAQRVGDP